MCLIIWVELMDPWSDGVRPVAGARCGNRVQFHFSCRAAKRPEIFLPAALRNLSLSRGV